MAYEKVESFAPLWVGEIGETLEGKIKSSRPDQYGGEQFTLEVIDETNLTIFVKEKNRVMHFNVGDLVTTPSHKMLGNLLRNVGVDAQVIIQAKSRQKATKTGMSDMVVYEVQVWKD